MIVQLNFPETRSIEGERIDWRNKAENLPHRSTLALIFSLIDRFPGVLPYFIKSLETERANIGREETQFHLEQQASNFKKLIDFLVSEFPEINSNITVDASFDEIKKFIANVKEHYNLQKSQALEDLSLRHNILIKSRDLKEQFMNKEIENLKSLNKDLDLKIQKIQDRHPIIETKVIEKKAPLSTILKDLSPKGINEALVIENTRLDLMNSMILKHKNKASLEIECLVQKLEQEKSKNESLHSQLKESIKPSHCFDSTTLDNSTDRGEEMHDFEFCIIEEIRAQKLHLELELKKYQNWISSINLKRKLNNLPSMTLFKQEDALALSYLELKQKNKDIEEEANLLRTSFHEKLAECNLLELRLSSEIIAVKELEEFKIGSEAMIDELKHQIQLNLQIKQNNLETYEKNLKAIKEDLQIKVEEIEKIKKHSSSVFLQKTHEFEGKLTLLEASISTLKSSRTELQNQVNSLKKINTELIEQLETEKNRNGTLFNELASEISTLKAQYTHSKANAQAIEAVKTSLEKDKADLEAEYINLKSEKANLEILSEELEKKSIKLSHDLSVLKHQNEEAVSSQNLLITENSLLSTTLESERAKSNSIYEELEKSQSTHDLLISRLSYLESSLSEVSTELTSSNSLNCELSSIVEKLNIENTRLSEELSKSENERFLLEQEIKATRYLSQQNQLLFDEPRLEIGEYHVEDNTKDVGSNSDKCDLEVNPIDVDQNSDEDDPFSFLEDEEFNKHNDVQKLNMLRRTAREAKNIFINLKEVMMQIRLIFEGLKEEQGEQMKLQIKEYINKIENSLRRRDKSSYKIKGSLKATSSKMIGKRSPISVLSVDEYISIAELSSCKTKSISAGQLRELTRTPMTRSKARASNGNIEFMSLSLRKPGRGSAYSKSVISPRRASSEHRFHKRLDDGVIFSLKHLLEHDRSRFSESDIKLIEDILQEGRTDQYSSKIVEQLLKQKKTRGVELRLDFDEFVVNKNKHNS